MTQNRLGSAPRRNRKCSLLLQADTEKACRPDFFDSLGYEGSAHIQEKTKDKNGLLSVLSLQETLENREYN